METVASPSRFSKKRTIPTAHTRKKKIKISNRGSNTIVVGRKCNFCFNFVSHNILLKGKYKHRTCICFLFEDAGVCCSDGYETLAEYIPAMVANAPVPMVLTSDLKDAYFKTFPKDSNKFENFGDEDDGKNIEKLFYDSSEEEEEVGLQSGLNNTLEIATSSSIEIRKECLPAYKKACFFKYNEIMQKPYVLALVPDDKK